MKARNLTQQTSRIPGFSGRTKFHFYQPWRGYTGTPIVSKGQVQVTNEAKFLLPQYAASWLAIRLPCYTPVIEPAALKANPSVVWFDLEDSIPLEDKKHMRAALSQMWECLREGSLPVKGKDEPLKSIPVAFHRAFVRVNSLDDRDLLEQDLKCCASSFVKGFIFPKSRCQDDILTFERMLKHLEEESGISDGHFKIVPIIETAAALLNVEAIAKSSDRVVSLIFGSADLAADMACLDTENFRRTYRPLVALAAKSAGIGAINTPTVSIWSYARFFRETQEAKSIGFSGTFCLTPRQAEISASAMSPSRLEQEWASQIKESLQKGVSRGVLQASPQHDKSYFGPPHHVMVDNIMGAVRDINGADACTSVNRGEFRFGKIHALYQGLNLSRAQPGKKVMASQSLTITQGWLDRWFSSFFGTTGFETNRVAAHRAGLNDFSVPFSLLMCLSVSVAIPKLSLHARVHLGFFDVQQHRAICVNDTVHSTMEITDITKTNSGHIITDTIHRLLVDGKVVFSLTKRTMFAPKDVKLKEMNLASDQPSHFDLDDILKAPLDGDLKRGDPIACKLGEACKALANVGAVEESDVQPVQLDDTFVHGLVKTLGRSETFELSSLMRLVNDHHFNTIRFDWCELLVPGPLVTSASIACSSREFGGSIRERWVHNQNLNKVSGLQSNTSKFVDVGDLSIRSTSTMLQVNHGDMISAVSVVHDVTRRVAHDTSGEPQLMEEITVQTLGVKNIDPQDIMHYGLPERLIALQPLRGAQVEEVCAQYGRYLMHHVACNTVRKILRPLRG